MKRAFFTKIPAALLMGAALCLTTSCGNKANTEQGDGEQTDTIIEQTTETEQAPAAAQLPEGELTRAHIDSMQVTPSGLHYEVLKEGTGDHPTATNTVTVHYTGKLPDGTIFDSSMARNEPATFPLNQVIPGWTEGLQLMNKGAQYRFYIPSELAYGAQGAPGVIPPNTPLIFEVELISFE